jgi:hypothetical protein
MVHSKYKTTYRPVLFHPEPFASTNKVRSQAQQIVDPRPSGSGTMISIVLHIESNKGLRYAINNSQRVRSCGSDPQVLQRKEKNNVKDGSSVPSQSSKLTSPTNNLEHFLFDFAFKGSIKLESAGLIRTRVEFL